MKHVAIPMTHAHDWRPAAGLASLVGFIALAFLAALPAFWIDTKGVYAELAKPVWAPPAWVFGPVWGVLYFLMGLSAWGVWRKRGWSLEIQFWLVQLGLNAVWTPIFFGLREPGWAFADILTLVLAITATMVVFARAALWSACLLLPYLGWVAFAATLNYALWQSNG